MVTATDPFSDGDRARLLAPVADPFQLFGALAGPTEAALRASIQRFGVLNPVYVDQHGAMLDGHHRRRIAEELGVGYDRIMRVCDDDVDRLEVARTLNADRRQLTEEQRRENAATLRGEGHSLRAIAGALGTSKDTIARDLSTVAPETVPERVTGIDGKSRPARRPRVLARDDREQARAQQALDVAGPDAPAKMVDLRRLERIARETQAEARRREPTEAITTAGDLDIRYGDFRHVLADLPTSSVDAVITDPPYPREFLPLYADLSQIAARVLKRDGVLVAMVGHYHLADYMAGLSRHLSYRWVGSYTLPGAHARHHVARVLTGWKPLLVYTRRDAKKPKAFYDVFASGERDKEHHHWGQSESGMADIVGRLTMTGQLVVDPFLGGGTTAVVCRDLGRRFVGCDSDAAAIATARERIAS